MPGLDGVRGLAILLVMLLHLGVMIPETPVEHAVLTGVSAGWIGVDLFFVLSGALITGILLDSRGGPRYFRNFYIRRVLRIFPLYFSILIFSFYVLPHFPHPKLENFARVEGNEVWYWLYLQNFAIGLQGGCRHAIMDVTWSLAIEEQFYLVWPLLVHRLPARRLVRLCLGVIAVGVALRVAAPAMGVDPWLVYVSTPTRLDGLCAGALVALALRSRAPREVLERAGRRVLAVGAAVTAVVAALSGGLPHDGRVVQSVGYTSLAAMFAGLVLLTILHSGTGSGVDRIMRSRVLTALGVYSYAIYLFHVPLRAVLRDTILRPEGFSRWPGGTLVAQLVFYVAAGAFAFVAAWASYHLFEKHFLRLKRVLAPAG
ncbi:MAG TPA: acyltransferase [Nannocystis sp.]